MEANCVANPVIIKTSALAICKILSVAAIATKINPEANNTSGFLNSENKMKSLIHRKLKFNSNG
jgi:hypothetical protein